MGQDKRNDREKLLRLLTADPSSQPEMDEASFIRLVEKQREGAGADWHQRLPVLRDGRVTLRELQLTDVPGLVTNLTPDEVTRFLSPPPRTIEEFERFVAWTHWERAAGNYACFAVVPDGFDAAVGLFQLRTLEPSFATAEWGFALGSAFWGTGLFNAAAHLVLGFAFDQIRTHRLEARVAVPNGRGNGALRKLGAVQEGILRRSFLCNGHYLDQALWSILDDDWRGVKETGRPTIH